MPEPDVRAEWGGYEGSPKRRLVVVSPGVCDVEQYTTAGSWKSVSPETLGVWDLASMSGYRLPFPGPKIEQIPAPLDSSEFRKAWSDWHAYRSRAKLRRWADVTRKSALGELAKLGSTRAITAIRHSIAKGYQGIYEPNGAGQSAQAPQPTESRAKNIAAWGKRGG